jgi:DNA gyrase/topoisomerase IV subunit A
MEILPAEGEIFLLASDGKAKRVPEKDFPKQGRYGKGVIAWDLPTSSPKGKKVKIAGSVSGKPNHVATIHLSKGAAKSARLDMASIRKRAASKGDSVVEVKAGEEVVSVNVGWSVEKFVMTVKEEKREQREVKKEKEAKKVAKAKVVVKKKKK